MSKAQVYVSAGKNIQILRLLSGGNTSASPTTFPTVLPTFELTNSPTTSQTNETLTVVPTTLPTTKPTSNPSFRPTRVPTPLQTKAPTVFPSPSPTKILIPSFAPTAAPDVPTAFPTAIPSADPAVPTAPRYSIYFEVNQTLVGVTASEFDSNPSYSLTVQETVAQIVGISYESISVALPVIPSSANSITIFYVVSSSNSPTSTKAAEASITAAVNNQDFSEILNENAVVNGATGLEHAKATTNPVYMVPTSAPTASPTKYPTLPPVRLPTLSPTYTFSSPTPAPSQTPTKQPGVPTRSPTNQVEVAFSVSQEIANFNAALYNNNSAPYIFTIQQTVAFAINSPGIVPSDILVAYLGLPNSAGARLGELQLLESSASILVSYIVSTTNAVGQSSAEMAYLTYTSNLNESIVNEIFDAYLQINAEDNGATGFTASFGLSPLFAPMLPTQQPSMPPVSASTKFSLNDGGIVGITIGVIAFVGIVIAACWYYFGMNGANRITSDMPTNHQINPIIRDATSDSETNSGL